MSDGRSIFAPIHTAPLFVVLDIEATQGVTGSSGKTVFLQCLALPSTSWRPNTRFSGLAPGWKATGWRPAANVPSQDALVLGTDGSGVAVQVELGVTLPGAI